MAKRFALPNELDQKYLEKRDLQETLKLATLYLCKVRCVGGHLVQDGFCCPHCPSMNPGEYCHLTNVTKEELLKEQRARIKTRRKQKRDLELATKGVNEIH